MGGSPEQPQDKRGFRRFAKDVLRRTKGGSLEGESMELTGDTEADAAGLLKMISGVLGDDPKALDDTLAESRKITDALAAATNLPNIARYDETLLVKLEFVATHFYGVKNDAVK